MPTWLTSTSSTSSGATPLGSPTSSGKPTAGDSPLTSSRASTSNSSTRHAHSTPSRSCSVQRITAAPVRAASPSHRWRCSNSSKTSAVGSTSTLRSCDNDYLAFGWYVNGTIHICETNHLGDEEELADTIRHEVWHAIQACNRGPLMYDLDPRLVRQSAGAGSRPATHVTSGRPRPRHATPPPTTARPRSPASCPPIATDT